MALKAVVQTLDDVEEAYRSEYKEIEDPANKGQKIFALDIENAGALPDVFRLTTSLNKERNDHKATKSKLAPFAALGDPLKLQEQLDRIPELEALAEGKVDDNKINSIVETRVKAKLTPLERELAGLRTQVQEKDGIIETFKTGEKKRTVSGEVTKAAKAAKVEDVAMEDVELYGERLFELDEDGNVVTKDGVGVTPGLSPKQWLEDILASGKKPHWFGTTQGGGARGSRSGGGHAGPNPWAHDSWNMTEQGRIVRENRARADKLAQAAGTTVGGARPKAPSK